MEEDSRREDADAQQGESARVPTAGEVLKCSLRAVIIAVAGIPLLAWWFMDDDPGQPVFLLSTGGTLLWAGVQRIA